MVEVHTPLRHTCPLAQVPPAAPQPSDPGTHVPLALHIWPIGHSAFGPHAVAWHTPFTHTWPFAHVAFEEQLEVQVIALHNEHWPLRHTWPIGHWLIELHCPAHELVVHDWHRPLVQTWPAEHSLLLVHWHCPPFGAVQPDALHTPFTHTWPVAQSLFAMHGAFVPG